jgi:hypothetical protein
LNSGLHACKASTLEPCLQSVLLWWFWRWGSCELFVGVGLKLWSSRVWSPNLGDGMTPKDDEGITKKVPQTRHRIQRTLTWEADEE